MASTSAVATSQKALDAILCDTLPRQGNWSDEEYLWLTDRTRRLIEFTAGAGVGTWAHQVSRGVKAQASTAGPRWSGNRSDW